MTLWVFFAFESDMRARYLGDWVEALSEDEENEFVATLKVYGYFLGTYGEGRSLISSASRTKE